MESEGAEKKFCFEFSSKNAGFDAFLLRKPILVARNRDPWEMKM